MPSLKAKAERLLALHRGPEMLVLPNSWDVASAALVVQAGFPAVATSSAGVAFSLGYPDQQRISRAEMMEAVGRIARHVPVPVTADLEAGYGEAPAAVAETVTLALSAGIVGANIEDSKGDGHSELLPLELSAMRIRAARQAADKAGVPFVINGRIDTYIGGGSGEAAYDETLRRAKAYRAAGADCIFVPFVAEPELIRSLVTAIDAPVNILAGPATPPLAVLKQLGVRRVSVGGSLARAAYEVVRRATAELLGPGTYGFGKGVITHGEMNKLLAR